MASIFCAGLELVMKITDFGLKKGTGFKVRVCTSPPKTLESIPWVRFKGLVSTTVWFCKQQAF